MNLFRKLKFELHLFQQFFTPPTPPLKQDESKTNLDPDTSQTHPSYAQQFLSVNVSNHAAQCQTDIVTRYGPQAPTRFTCPVELQFEHEPSISECRLKKNYEKRTEISASLAFLALPMEQR